MNKSIVTLVARLMRSVAPASAIVFGLAPSTTVSAPGDLDPSFGKLGLVGPIMDFSGPAWSAQALDNDGILIGGGSFEKWRWGLFRVHLAVAACRSKATARLETGADYLNWYASVAPQ